MSLIKCPACEKEVSTEAKACPHCGRPLTPATPVGLTASSVTNVNLRRGVFRFWAVWSLAWLLIIPCCSALVSFRYVDSEHTRCINRGVDRPTCDAYTQ